MSCEGTTCAEGPANKITLNGQNQGTQESEEFFTATVKFYAAADANQLPLRRVVVDWGDGKLFASRPSFSGDYTSADNFFKNARGFQPGTETPICNLDTEWGKTAESCSASYFQASHVYSCRSGLPDCTGVRKDAAGQPMIACYDSAAEACIFRPRVHVRDNWGYCAGVCNKGGNFENPGNQSSSCYSGDVATLLDGMEDFDECDIEYWNDLSTGGKTDTVAGSNDPWVYYDGLIYVK
jgi:hypothetical protein